MAKAASTLVDVLLQSKFQATFLSVSSRWQYCSLLHADKHFWCSYEKLKHVCYSILGVHYHSVVCYGLQSVGTHWRTLYSVSVAHRWWGLKTHRGRHVLCVSGSSSSVILLEPHLISCDSTQFPTTTLAWMPFALTDPSADSVSLCLWFQWTNESDDLCWETTVLLKVKQFVHHQHPARASGALIFHRDLMTFCSL